MEIIRQDKLIRESGIEMLRIMSICGVIVLHFVFPTAVGYDSDNTNYLLFLENLFIGSVNIFIIITGYFMINNNTRVVNKPLSLLFQIAFYLGGAYLLTCVWGNNTFDIGGFIYTIIPRNYFVVLYITLFFISPYINKCINSISPDKYNQILYITFLIMSFLPFIVDFMTDIFHLELTGMNTLGHFGGQSGGTLIHFMYMYMLGGLICKNKDTIDAVKTRSVLIICMASFVANYGLVLCFKDLMLDASKSLWSYYNPLIILQSCTLFILFSRIKIRNKYINNLAKSSFACFICHGFLLGQLPVEKMIGQNPLIMTAYLFGAIILFYIIIWVVYQLYSLIFEPLIMKKKIFLNY